MTAEAFLDEAPLDAEAFLDEAQTTSAPTAESFLDAPVEDEPALPAATPSPVPTPNPELDAARDAGMREDQLIREEGIFPEGSQSWKVLDGRIYIDPARYNSAVENLWSSGVIDSDSYTQLLKGTVDQYDEASRTVIPSVEKATAARRDLERRAGAFPEVKAAASGLLKGAMQTGAAIVGGSATAGLAAPTGPGAIPAAIVGGTAAALGTGYAYDKALELSSKESDLLDSFYAANQLKPGYNTGGQLVSILAPTPVSISRLANAANLIQAEKGSAAAAKFVTGAFGAGAGIGVATDATIQVANLGLDKVLHPDISKEVAMEHFRQTGEQLAPRPQYDPASTGISAIFGGLGAGLGVKARNKTYAPEELVTLESQVKTGRATRQEAEDYRVMRQAVDTLRADERLLDAQAIRRATVDAAGFRFLDTTEIINPRFQRELLAYAAENPAAAVPLSGSPAAYTGQAFINRGGPAPAFQGGSNALPGPEGVPALPGPAAEPSNILPFDPTTATLVDDIPPTASAPVASTLTAPEPTGSPELITGEGATVSTSPDAANDLTSAAAIVAKLQQPAPKSPSRSSSKTMADAGPLEPSANVFVPKSNPEMARMPLQITSLPEAVSVAQALTNKPLANAETQMSATLSLNSLAKIGNAKAIKASINEEAHALAVANIEHLFKEAQHLGAHPDKKGNMNMEKVHRFGAAMIMGSEPYGVKITVFEYKNPNEGNRIYTVEAVDVEKLKSAGQLVPGGDKPVPNTPIADFDQKLFQIVGKVKAEMKPALETYNDAQVFADFPDAVGVVRSSKGGWTMPMILGGTDKVPAIEMPELVEMVRSLTGNDPVLRRMPKALGTFNPGSGIITLRPDLFQNEASAMLTFAHEIGHLVSWMDERNIKLGNLGGHIMNVANYLKTTFPITPGAGPALTTADRRKLQAQAKSENPSDPDARTARYRELVQQTMDTRNLGAVSEKQGGYSPNIREELINLSEWWKPFSYDDAKDSYVDYRHSAEELYADAISVLFNSPADLQTRAPVFWKAFWNYADARPQVKASIFEIQNRILMGRDAVLDKRLARDLESFKAGAEVFVGKQAAAAERRASLTGWWENLKDQYWNRYQPLIESAAKARAAGTITKAEEDGIRWLTEEHPLADSKLQLKLADIGRLYQSLDAAGVPRDYFGVWLKHHRIANERYEVTEKIKGMDLTVEKGRAVMANPGGETARTSAEMLASLQQRLGPEKTAALESAVAGFRDVVFSIMEDANEAGLFSADLWEIISANRDNYAAFTPLEYVQEYLPSAIRKQVGTFKEIADPLQQTVLKTISIHRAAQNNRFKRAAVEAIRQTAPELVKPAPMKYNGKAMVPQESQETGLSLVQWKEDGQLTGVHLPDRYARMWEDQSPAERDAILKLLSTGFQRLVYGAIIRYNPAFQLFMSPARDLQRSITNMPGGIQGRARFLQRLLDPETWGASVEWARGDIGKSELLREMIENAATGGPHSAFGGRMGSDDDSLDAILRKYHLQDQQSRNTFVRALMAPLKGIEFAGQVLQLLPKAAAYKVLVKDTGMPAPQAANTIRNHIGIPNYYKKGRHAQAAGALVPFLNIFLRSYDSLQRNIRGAERNMGGKEWWLTWALTGGGLIAVMQTLAKEGLFGEDLEKLYSRVPTWDMTNFAVLPLGEVPTGETGGKTVYARLPQDEGLRVINGVVSKMLTSAIRSAKGDPTAPQLGEVFAGISSQVPGTNTLVELGQNWTTFLAGRNPRDDFRNRYILSDDQWLAGGWEATKPMLGWTLEQTGITNFFTYDDKADTLTEVIIGATPILNRFIKISDRGVYQSQAKVEEADKRDMAKVRLSLPDQVNGLRTEYNYLKNQGENRSDRETLRYYELGQWYRTYRQAMDEVETNMEFGNRAAAQSAIRGLVQDSKLYKAR